MYVNYCELNKKTASRNRVRDINKLEKGRVEQPQLLKLFCQFFCCCCCVSDPIKKYSVEYQDVNLCIFLKIIYFMLFLREDENWGLN